MTAVYEGEPLLPFTVDTLPTNAPSFAKKCALAGKKVLTPAVLIGMTVLGTKTWLENNPRVFSIEIKPRLETT